MKTILLSMGIFVVVILSSAAHAAPGEWWEVSSKMDMEGMPFAMPAQTVRVCMPKGGESDPRYTQGKDSNCKMTDVKQSGNTVKFKGVCVSQGETMNMVGETTHDGKSFKSNMKMSGKSGGEPVNMSMVSNGKYIGGSCDSEEMVKKARASEKTSTVKPKKITEEAAEAEAGASNSDSMLEGAKKLKGMFGF